MIPIAEARRFNHRVRTGFTLIEIIASMVLMTMLFAALTSLLRTFANQQRTLDRLSNTHSPTLQLEQLLRRDLTNARSIQATSTRLLLVGNLALDRRTGMPSGERAEVSYIVQSIVGVPWLIRRETSIDRMSSDRTIEVPIWQGVSEFEFVGATTWPADTPNITDQATVVVAEAPSNFQLVVRNEEGHALVQLHVVHHWETN